MLSLLFRGVALAAKGIGWATTSPLSKMWNAATVVGVSSVADDLTGGHVAGTIKHLTDGKVDVSPGGLAETAINTASKIGGKVVDATVDKVTDEAGKLLQGNMSSLQGGLPLLLALGTFLYSYMGKDGNSLGSSALHSGLMLTVAFGALHYASKAGWLDNIGDMIKSFGFGDNAPQAPQFAPEPGM